MTLNSKAFWHVLSLASELNLLRNVEANNQESGVAAKSSSLLSSFRSSPSYNHEAETIFALPRMQLDFKSIHVQDPDEPSLTGTQQSNITLHQGDNPSAEVCSCAVFEGQTKSFHHVRQQMWCKLMPLTNVTSASSYRIYRTVMFYLWNESLFCLLRCGLSPESGIEMFF